MLYCTRIDVMIPTDMAPAAMTDLRERETARAKILQEEGVLVHLWRIAGQTSNISVWNCKDHDELHGVLTSMPMFAYFRIEVIPLARHPSAVKY
jgi:muconolactone D-isomerase